MLRMLTGRTTQEELSQRNPALLQDKSISPAGPVRTYVYVVVHQATGVGEVWVLGVDVRQLDGHQVVDLVGGQERTTHGAVSCLSHVHSFDDSGRLMDMRVFCGLPACCDVIGQMQA